VLEGLLKEPTKAATKEELLAGSTADPGSERHRNWAQMYAALAEFKKKHGHCDVPPDWPEDPDLARWVADQRRSWAKGTLTSDHFWKLSSLGFDFVG
jgi:hypothetical protein